MPDSWHERMETIRNYQEDASAMSRIAAWELSINIANASITGGGFNPFSKATTLSICIRSTKRFVAHSIYFSVLACHGWPGLIMFLIILFLTWRSLSKTERESREDPDKRSLNILARMLKISLSCLHDRRCISQSGIF